MQDKYNRLVTFYCLILVPVQSVYYIILISKFLNYYYFLNTSKFIFKIEVKKLLKRSVNLVLTRWSR